MNVSSTVKQLSRKAIIVIMGSIAVLAGSIVLAIALTTPASAAAPIKTLVVTATAAPFPGGTTATATCPADHAVTGGGFNAGSAAGTAVGASHPSDNGWTAVMTGGPSGAVLTVYAVCGSI